MPHALLTDTGTLLLHDVLDVGGGAEQPHLRLHALRGGDAVAIVSADATCDGLPLLGQLALVPWGRGALIRYGRVRAEIAWRACSERRAAATGERCRVCFRACAPGPAV